MPRICTVLILAVCATTSTGAFAEPSHCNPTHIQAAFESTHTVPNLRNCNPSAVGPIVSGWDYGFEIQNHIASNSVPEGRIVRQRFNDGTVYVDVSSGPDPQAGGGQGGGWVPVIGQVVSQILTHPPSHGPEPPPQQAPPTPVEQPPQLTEVVPAELPPPPPPAATPEPVQPTPVPPAPTPKPPPPPAPKPMQPTQANVPPAVQTPPKVKPPKPPAPAPAVQDDVSPPAPQPAPVVSTASIEIPPKIVPPPQFSIGGDPSVRIGDKFHLTIVRLGDDGKTHRLLLRYTGALLVSAPGWYDFSPGPKNQLTLGIPTSAERREDGSSSLTVTLNSTDQAQVREPSSLKVLIEDRLPWWKRLLQLLVASPLLAAGVAAAVVAAAAGTGKILWPRATCSIGRGSFGVRPVPLKTGWPALHVDTTIGAAAVSIPRPLPIRRRTHVEPSPA